jgi:UDP-GlcNAc:undecaprenyl-phosphate/decaprenyl-phosphate GlcNAc-1-phosphate transferase
LAATNFFGAAAALAIAWLAALVLTPIVARLATRLGAVDYPDGRRKSHSHPVPRAGGVAVALAAMVAMAVAMGLTPSAEEAASTWLVRGLVPALLVLLVVGIIDDVFTLTGIYKLIGQVLAVSVLVAAGAQFDQISLFGVMLPLGDFRIPFTLFFCLGAINAFNLIDGADGLAASIGAIVCTCLGVLTASRGDVPAALACFALSGALIGFLRYNVPPAKVYLGDTGSMLIGLVVAAVAIDCSIKQQAAFVLSVPIAICAIPILDATAALVRRVTTGQSVFTADRGHLHHALLLRGWTVGMTVAFIAGLTAITSCAALISYFTNNDVYALAVTGGVFATLAVARVFGHTEAALIASHSRSFVRGLVLRGAGREESETERSVQLQGKRKWQKVWTALREAAPLYNVAGLTLQVSIPQLHESFFATWKRNDAAVAGDDVWRITLPLVLDERPIGKLTLVGTSGGRQALVDMQQMLDYLDSLHAEIADIVDNEEPAGKRWAIVQATPAIG